MVKSQIVFKAVTPLPFRSVQSCNPVRIKWKLLSLFIKTKVTFQQLTRYKCEIWWYASDWVVFVASIQGEQLQAVRSASLKTVKDNPVLNFVNCGILQNLTISWKASVSKVKAWSYIYCEWNTCCLWFHTSIIILWY